MCLRGNDVTGVTTKSTPWHGAGAPEGNHKAQECKVLRIGRVRTRVGALGKVDIGAWLGSLARCERPFWFFLSCRFFTTVEGHGVSFSRPQGEPDGACVASAIGVVLAMVFSNALMATHLVVLGALLFS